MLKERLTTPLLRENGKHRAASGDDGADGFGARAAEPEDGAGISGVVRGRLDRAGDARVHEALRRAAGKIRAAGGNSGAAAENRQRTLHARLLEVQPVLQVRGSLRFGCTEYEMGAAGTWDEYRQARTETICPYCGVGCELTVHAQEGQIVKVSSPLDHSVAHGNLCVKGRFGWQFTQVSENGSGVR